MKTPILEVRFFKTETNNEPVRNWLQLQTVKDKKRIGEDIKTVQFGWPLGMPLVRHIDGEIWEIRCRLSGGIARVLFVLENNIMILIHGFIKKQQKIPKQDLDLAKTRVKQLRRSV
ncbi:type II toxin-antitoxin system RelE/ParE family toxin [Polynucleobacter sp. AP-Kaivos-20-H2]|uniref:type II toxin-antitoxin system RelE/ParE family toxin n=1 Tax=Polynucleobacter sp. AP-Kaivos-20-H2 TaxID=2689104 RepID=UPI001C0C98E4|nr:type II toxin-antitoxin system RelE/ParE family toxin [Polynucleobacter sp. AP-Kaivos-20-H2]MBU3602893.1 type II toxin-antitoxin system RelE/ParE family toxin [Polynucleobacter sp. AP-Kaivos-20-H2]